MANNAPDRLKVLVVRVGAMGDVLHALPAVAALREKVPNCFIGWAIEPAWKPLLEAADGSRPLLDRVHSVPTRDWKRRPLSLQTARGIMALRRELRAEQYDVCVDLQGSIRSAVIGRLAGAARFVGADEPRERQARMLYGERIPLRTVHVIGQACELLGAGVGVYLAPGKVLLPMSTASSMGVGYVLLAPTAGWGAKMWPAQRYRELAIKLGEAGFRVLVNASGSRDSVPGQVAVGGVAEVVSCGVDGLLSLVRGAALVIGGDTGPVQMAGTLGVPTLALFGPTDPARTGPGGFPGSQVMVLRDGGSRVDHRRHAETEAGLRRIGVEMVLETALKMLHAR